MKKVQRHLFCLLGEWETTKFYVQTLFGDYNMQGGLTEKPDSSFYS